MFLASDSIAPQFGPVKIAPISAHGLKRLQYNVYSGAGKGAPWS
jgi:hypothetical protein